MFLLWRAVLPREWEKPGKRYGCKSLVPLGERAAIQYVLAALRKATYGRIILTIEKGREDIFDRLNKQIQFLDLPLKEKIQVRCGDQEGTTQAIHDMRDILTGNEILVVYGHHLVTVGHLEKMLEFRGRGKLVMSLYNTSSNVSRKVMRGVLETGTVSRPDEFFQGEEAGSGDLHEHEDEHYIDAPYLVPRSFVFDQPPYRIRSHEAIVKWQAEGGEVIGLVADFPHEFHYEHELERLEGFANELGENLFVE